VDYFILELNGLLKDKNLTFIFEFAILEKLKDNLNSKLWRSMDMEGSGFGIPFD